MNYQPKVVKCRLKTGGKTIQEIRERCAGQGMTYRDFENIQRANEYFDGLIIRATLWEYDQHSGYHLQDWNAPDDEKMMMALYYSEQVHPFPRYKNDLEKFKADWAAEKYDPGAAIVFHPADVEEIEVISEEVIPPPEPPTPAEPPAAPSRKSKKRRKKRRRK